MERASKTELLEMKQTGLMERVIEALGLDDGYAQGKHTPAKTKPLVKDEDGVAAVEGFSYSSVVGIWNVALPFRAHSTRHCLCRQLLC
jgi:hypothetical protein